MIKSGRYQTEKKIVAFKVGIQPPALIACNCSDLHICICFNSTGYL